MTEIPERLLTGDLLPSRLRDLRNPPEVLYVRGELPRGPCVAIVGTRKPTRNGARFAYELSAELARAGVAVASGGAAGIDTQAHRGALDAGGFSLVVAPSGFDRPYPPENGALFERVLASGGAYVSRVASDVTATRVAFFPRNECLVALSHVVVVVQAPIRSGARNAAKFARNLGRPLFAVPAAPWQSRGRGCLAELQLGARLLQSARDVLKVLEELRLHAVPLPGVEPPRSSRGVRTALANQKSFAFAEPCDSDGELSSVLETIRGGASYVDAVCLQTGLPASRVNELILTLTLRGVLVPDPSGRLQIAKSRI